MSHTPGKSPHFWFLDAFRFLLIAAVVVHHAATGYSTKWHTSFFIDNFASNAKGSLIYDVLFLMPDTFMIPGLFFLAGLLSLPSLKRRGMPGYIQERLLRLAIPFVLGVTLLSPIHVYFKHLTETPFPLRYVDFWCTLFWGPKFQMTAFWFLAYLLFLSALLLLFYRVFPRVWNFFTCWVKWLIDHPWWALALFCFKGVILVGASDLFFGARWWIRLFSFLPVIGSQFLLNALYFFSGALLGSVSFLEKTDHIQALSQKWLLWLMGTLLFATTYFWYIFSYEDIAYAKYFRYSFMHLNNTLAQSWPFLKAEALGTLTRTTLFVLTGVFANLFVLAVSYRLLNTPYKVWASLGACAYGIYIFHEAVQVFPAYWMMPLEWPLFVKFSILCIVGVVFPWGLTAFLRKIPTVKRIL